MFNVVQLLNSSSSTVNETQLGEDVYVERRMCYKYFKEYYRVDGCHPVVIGDHTMTVDMK